MTTRTSTERMKRLEAAFACLADIYRQSACVVLERGVPQIVPPRPNSILTRRLAELGDAAAELLAANRKDWAKDKREVVLAVSLEKGQLARVAALELAERRTIGRSLYERTLDPAAMARLKALMTDLTGVVVATPDHATRAAVGLLLADLDAGRGRFEMTETGTREAVDYRNYLAGSVWLDMNLSLEGDLPGQALLAALQVRSTRRDALRTTKQGYYTALAAGALQRAGQEFDAIQKRLNVPADTLARWLKRDLSTPPAARPPSEAQAGFIRDILADLPFLDIFLEPSWRTDAAAAKAFLDRVGEHQAGWRAQMREIRRLMALRRALATGVSLDEACREAGFDPSGAMSAFRKTPRDLAAALGRSIAKVAGRPVDVPL